MSERPQIDQYQPENDLEAGRDLDPYSIFCGGGGLHSVRVYALSTRLLYCTPLQATYWHTLKPRFSNFGKEWKAGFILDPVFNSGIYYPNNVGIFVISSHIEVPPSSDFDKTRHLSTFVDISRHFSTRRISPGYVEVTQMAPPSPKHPKHLHPGRNTSKKRLHPGRNTSIRQTIRNFQNSKFLDFTRLFSTDHQKFSKLDISRHFSTFLDASQMHEKC